MAMMATTTSSSIRVNAAANPLSPLVIPFMTSASSGVPWPERPGPRVEAPNPRPPLLTLRLASVRHEPEAVQVRVLHLNALPLSIPAQGDAGKSRVVFTSSDAGSAESS